MFLLLFLYSFPLLKGQGVESNDPCGCNAILANGAFSSYLNQNTSIKDKDFLSIFSSLSYKQFKEFMEKNYSGEAEFSYDLTADGKGRFSKNMTEEKWRVELNKLKKVLSTQSYEESTSNVIYKTGDKEINKSWSDCKGNCNLNDGSVTWWQEDIENDELGVKIRVRYNQPFGVSDAPQITSSTITGGKSSACNTSNCALPKGTKISSMKGGNEFYVSRENPNNQIVIQLNYLFPDKLTTGSKVFIIPSVNQKPGLKVSVDFEPLNGFTEDHLLEITIKGLSGQTIGVFPLRANKKQAYSYIDNGNKNIVLAKYEIRILKSSGGNATGSIRIKKLTIEKIGSGAGNYRKEQIFCNNGNRGTILNPVKYHPNKWFCWIEDLNKRGTESCNIDCN